MWYCRSKKRGRRTWPLMSALVLSFFTGCTLVVPPVEMQAQQMTVKGLTALLHEREATMQTMKGLFSVKVRAGIIPIASRVEGALYYRHPNILRVRGFNALSSELFEFVQIGEELRLKLPTMDQVLSGSASDMSTMGKLARPFQLGLWAMRGMLGVGIIGENETGVLIEDGTRYRLEISGVSPEGTSMIHRRLWFDPKTWFLVREERLAAGETVEAILRYEDFKVIDGADRTATREAGNLWRPFKIFLNDGKNQGSVEVTFHEMIPNQPITATDFPEGSLR